MIRTALARQAIDEAIRSSFAMFLKMAFETLHPGHTLEDAWYLDALCHKLIQVQEGAVIRLLITLPPRYLKSVCVSVAYVAWRLAHDPSLEILVVSYGAELGVEHAANFRRLIQAPWFRRAFPALTFTKNTETLVETSAGGCRRTSTLQGAVTGLGADIIIVDDLMKAQDATSPVEREKAQRYYTNALVTRLNDKAVQPIIVVGQRLHDDDLPGYLIRTGLYDHLCLPAIAIEDAAYALGGGRVYLRPQGEALAPHRESLEVLERLRQEIGARTFEAQYQQAPGASESGLLSWQKVHFYEEAPERSSWECVAQSWDTGMTADPERDYTVGTTWAFSEGAWYLVDLVRGHWAYPDLKRQVVAARNQWRADIIIIEKGGVGTALIDDLFEERRLALIEGRCPAWRISPYQPKDEKLSRFSTQVDKIESGRVLFPKAAPWLPALRAELLAFPDGRHDDQVDSISQFLEWQTATGAHVRLGRKGRTIRRNIERKEVVRRDIVRR